MVTPPCNNDTSYLVAPPPSAPDGDIPSLPEIPGADDFNLPSVPNSTNPGAGPPGNSAGNDIDFDDLAARFENLKKKK